MEAPGAGPSLDELLAERYERLSDFINVDRLNLFAAVSLLNARYLATGPTDQEVPNDSVPVLEWASTVGMQRAAEVLLVGLWSALESFVEDVFVLVCMHRSFGSGQLPNARARLGEFMTLTEEERWRVVWERAEKAGKPKSGGKFAVYRGGDVFKPLEISVDIQP